MRNPFDLYAGHPQLAEATREIKKALKEAIKLAKKGTPHDKAMAVLDPVFDKYMDAGAADSEPRNICWDMLEEAVGESW
jgi:hypothetical protein